MDWLSFDHFQLPPASFAIPFLLALSLIGAAPAQETTGASIPDSVVLTHHTDSPAVANEEVPDKRMFGIIPNARSSPDLLHYSPLTIKEKFKIASDDSFDRGTVVLGLVFAAERQLSNASTSFGQGMAGYRRYAATAYADFAVGNMMTEGLFPSMLHQDPRYFRRGTGSGWSRLGTTVKQIFWTRTDSGETQFNFSEFGGNAAAVAISNAYYPDNRNVGDAVSKLGSQIGVDMAANILKEFGPDLSRHFRRQHRK